MMIDPMNCKVEDLVCDQSFQNYCLGLSQSEEDYWQDWELKHPELKQVVAEAKRIVGTLSLHQGKRLENAFTFVDGLDRQSLFKINLQHFELSTQAKERTHKQGRINFKRYYKYAASLILLISVGYVVYKLGVHKSFVTQYYTGVHSHKTILLPDNSVVVLNENSTLSVPNDFDANHRSVFIKGEGYFDIKHDADHPFVVHTDAYKIRVLGTVFNVKAYPDEGSTETSLVRGKVEITPNDEGHVLERIMLKPAQKYVLKRTVLRQKEVNNNSSPDLKSGRVLHMALDVKTHVASETSWARKKIQIKDETLQQIAGRLESWYGVRIVINDPEVGQYRYTATFDDETILNVLNALQLSYPFHYSVESNTIIIDNK